jgi:hypothetical protein
VSHEVAQENHGSAEDADQEQLLAAVVFGDALPDLAHLPLHLSSDETSSLPDSDITVRVTPVL